MTRVKGAKSTQIKVQEHRKLSQARALRSLQILQVTLRLPLFPPPAALGTFFRAAGRRGLWRRKRSFTQKPCSPILVECHLAPTVSAIPQHPLSLRGFWVLLGRSRAGRHSMTFRPGPSSTTGPILFQSRKPRSRCSSAVSATSSMNCSGRNYDVTMSHAL